MQIWKKEMHVALAVSKGKGSCFGKGKSETGCSIKFKALTFSLISNNNLIS
jgi:hypothetical protein